jgi:hypothetical protein
MGFPVSSAPDLYQTLASRPPPSTCLYMYSFILIVVCWSDFFGSIGECRSGVESREGIIYESIPRKTGGVDFAVQVTMK